MTSTAARHPRSPTSKRSSRSEADGVVHPLLRAVAPAFEPTARKHPRPRRSAEAAERAVSRSPRVRRLASMSPSRSKSRIVVASDVAFSNYGVHDYVETTPPSVGREALGLAEVPLAALDAYSGVRPARHCPRRPRVAVGVQLGVGGGLVPSVHALRTVLRLRKCDRPSTGTAVGAWSLVPCSIGGSRRVNSKEFLRSRGIERQGE